MTMILLRKLASGKLPAAVHGGDDVDVVHILMLGGHVEGVLGKAVKTPTGWMNPTATVTRITHTGRRMLKLFPERPADDAG